MTDIEKQIEELAEDEWHNEHELLKVEEPCAVNVNFFRREGFVIGAKAGIELERKRMEPVIEALKEICTYEKETNAYNTIAYEALEKVADKTTGQEIIDGLKWAIKEEKKCKFCKKEKDTLCEHGYCPACQCPEYCWLD